MKSHNKISITLFIIAPLLFLTLSEDLKIKKVDRGIILNANYPIEQTYIEFQSNDNVNIFKHLVPFDIA